jgi:hypothetical protein
MLIGELLHIDETLLLLLADVMQQSGLRQLPDTAEEPAPVQGAPRTGTLHVLRQSGEVTISCHYPNHEEPS